MRARTVIGRAAAVACLLACGSAWGQGTRSVSIVPQVPEAGSAFSVIVALPGEQADSVSPVEPAISGPARYIGADVRPGAMQGQTSVVVEYRFMSMAPGRVDILGLSVLVRGRSVKLGSWSLDVAPGLRPPAVRHGSWRAPATVVEREAFIVEALGPFGQAAECPTFAVRGALVEPLPGKPGVFRIAALAPGSIRLPRLEAHDDEGSFELEPFTVAASPLPQTASDARAVGGSWRLELVEPRRDIEAEPGQAVAWHLRAAGRGWAGLAEPPEMSLAGPGGLAVALVPGSTYTAQADDGFECRTGIQGVLVAGEPGVYLLRPEPYPWFDPLARSAGRALAPAIRVIVSAGVARPWSPPGELSGFARRNLAALAGGDTGWSRASEAASRSDWAAALGAAREAAGLRAAQAAEAPRREAAVLAALAMLSGEGGDAGRARAYAGILHSVRGAFPPAGISAVADALAVSFGNLARHSYVIPPAGYCAVAAAVALAFLLASTAVVLSRRRRNRGQRPTRTAMLALAPAAVLTVLCVAMAIASVAERSDRRFVSLGGMARFVPSESSTGRLLRAGSAGRVLESAGSWLFVELDDGGPAWLVLDQVEMY